MSLLKIFTNKTTKNIGIRVFKNKKLHKTISPKKLRFRRNDPFQLADPFLIEYENEVYCFYEEKAVNKNGIIKVLNLTTLIESQLVNIGTNTHLSFPFVFQRQGSYYMIPETNELNEVAIYKCEEFPLSWRKKVVLLKGKFVDSSVVEYNGVYYLFTTHKILEVGKSNYHLEVYFSDDLFGNYIKHPMSPIQKGKKYGRLGGSLVKNGNNLYRFSQDCEEFYGSELHRFKISKLTREEIVESIYAEKYISTNYGLKLGGHHYSCMIQSKNNSFWEAIDVNNEDNYFQRFLQIIYAKIN
jgi:hypothetical protein